MHTILEGKKQPSLLTLGYFSCIDMVNFIAIDKLKVVIYEILIKKSE
jgi:hypothetical protein